VVFICGEIKDLVSDSDKHYAYLADPNDEDLNYEFDGLNEDEVEDLKREFVFSGFVFGVADKQLLSWERSHTAVRELIHLIPNFQKKIDEGSPEELNQFYAEASKIS
jgi:hypothetical protein